jgi:tRNA pseudouridine38-40 synthase
MPESTPLRNLRALIAYDGTPFGGWERQANALGIQEVLEEAVFTIAREQVSVHGSGRTDAGVHALGQVANFHLRSTIHPEKLRLGLNAVLPPEIAVLELAEAPFDFHARKSARSKRYRYTILNDPTRRPTLRHVAFHVPRPLDLDAMAWATAQLPGTHDFSAFAKEADLRRSCVRTILEACVRAEPPLVLFEIEGTGFLYNMVRILAGTLIEVGLGRRPASTVEDLLRGGRRALAGWTAPPGGLCLLAVRYEPEACSGSEPPRRV